MEGNVVCGGRTRQLRNQPQPSLCSGKLVVVLRGQRRNGAKPLRPQQCKDFRFVLTKGILKLTRPNAPSRAQILSLSPSTQSLTPRSRNSASSASRSLTAPYSTSPGPSSDGGAVASSRRDWRICSMRDANLAIVGYLNTVLSGSLAWNIAYRREVICAARSKSQPQLQEAIVDPDTRHPEQFLPDFGHAMFDFVARGTMGVRGAAARKFF